MARPSSTYTRGRRLVGIAAVNQSRHAKRAFGDCLDRSYIGGERCYTAEKRLN
jgi:hypothetical protein